MGTALLRAWIGAEGYRIEVVDPEPSAALLALCAEYDLRVTSSHAGLAVPDVLVLAVKPQLARAVASQLGMALNYNGTVISIMAGITIHTLRELFPAASCIVRAMPNIATGVGAGVVSAVAEDSADARARTIVAELFSATGTFDWVSEEAELDVATALAGSGPAYVFYLVECLAQASIELGLDAASARRQARQMLIGTARLLERSPEEPDELRRQVTSPGGTTEAAIKILTSERALSDLVKRAVAAAVDRSKSLS
jgi:pyrroline-5-carboxylate reductase